MASDYILLPMPRQITVASDMHRLESGRYIHLAGNPDELGFAGRTLRSALCVRECCWTLTTAAGSDPAMLGAVLAVDRAVVPRPQGYRLTISPERIQIIGHDAAGVLYGVHAVRQLLRQAPAGQLPCLFADDWPDMPARGIMLDISRDKVPTMDTLFSLVDMLAEWRINQLQLYTEHTFAYRNHGDVWENASPMTGEQVLELDAYCRERHMELVPNQNSFGHWHRWLELPRYQELAEAPDGFESPWGARMGAFSLCPEDPRSIALLAELFDEFLPHFSSRQFNVGCDETWDLGKGRSKAACEARGVGRVYLDFLLEIYRLTKERGRTMQFWGDIILKHPELIPELPKDLIALEWGYEADHPFAEDTQKFAAAEVPFCVCPGTSSWNSIVGRTDNAVGNLRNAAENGIRNGAVGFLNTDWGDGGHWQPLPVSYLGFAYGAALSWSVAQNRDLNIARALDLHAFQDANGTMGQLAYDLGNAYLKTELKLGNANMFHRALQSPDFGVRNEDGTPAVSADALRATEAYIHDAMANLPTTDMHCRNADLIRREYCLAAGLARHAVHLVLARLETDDGAIQQIAADTRKSLAAELDGLIAEHQAVWLARNRSGGLKDSVARFRPLRDRYRS